MTEMKLAWKCDVGDVASESISHLLTHLGTDFATDRAKLAMHGVQRVSVGVDSVPHEVQVLHSQHLRYIQISFAFHGVISCFDTLR